MSEAPGVRFRLGGRLLYRRISDPFVGGDVFELQSQLDDRGFDAGPCDGSFGRRTEDALRAFQRECGLVNDGCCGPRTLQELFPAG